MKRNLPAIALLLVFPLLAEDFEKRHFNEYKTLEVHGTAFGHGPDDATRTCGLRIGACSGDYLVSSFTKGDAATGRLLLPAAPITHDYLTFLISGGNNPGLTCVNLLIDGEVVRSATGHNSDLLREVAFDLRELRNREARIEILDRHRGAWGHINADRFRYQDEVPTCPIVNAIAPARYTATPEGLFLNGQRITDLRLSLSETRREPQALHLTNGDILRGDIRELKDGFVRIGEQQIPMAEVAGFELAPISGTPKSGTLYRNDGEPIPGKLVWLKGDSLAIDCVLGVLPVPRASVSHYFLRTPQAGEGSQVTLVDGSVLHGELGYAEGAIVIGEREIPLVEVAEIRVASDRAIPLAKLPHRAKRSLGPIGPPPAPELQPDHLRLRPDASAMFAIPAEMNEFHAVLAPAPGSRGDTVLTLREGKRELLRETVTPGDAPREIRVAISANSKLIVAADFGAQAAIPSGLDLRDPYVRAR